MQLVFAAVSGLPRWEDGGHTLMRLRAARPAILRPQPRYTGKQVVSAVLDALLSHQPPPANQVTVSARAKLPAKAWCDPATKPLEGMPADDALVVRSN